LKALLESWDAPYKEKKAHVHALFYEPESLKPPLRPASPDSVIQIANQEYNINRLLPEKVFNKMVDVDVERKLIKNLTVDYERFIRQGSIDEIKRTCEVQTSEDPKEQKIFRTML
jgi:hypothetical protein